MDFTFLLLHSADFFTSDARGHPNAFQITSFESENGESDYLGAPDAMMKTFWMTAIAAIIRKLAREQNTLDDAAESGMG